MKLLLVAALVAVVGHAHAATPANNQLGQLGSALIGMVARGGTTASLTPAGGDDYNVLWAAWSDDTATPRTIHLALVRREGNTAQASWTMQRKGYSPVITPLDGWAFGTRGLVLLTYQTGGASTQGDVLGITGGMAKSLGSFNGSAIEISTVDGMSVVAVFEGADLKAPPVCYGWNPSGPSLYKTTCLSDSH